MNKKFYQEQKKLVSDRLCENGAAFEFLKNELTGLISAEEIFSNNDLITDQQANIAQELNYDSINSDRFFVSTTRDNRYFLVDANVNSREMLAITKAEHIYTATGVNTEAASKWDKVLDSSHIFQSVSVADIKNNSGLVTITASFGNGDELESIIYFDSTSCAIKCSECSAPTRGVLTSDSGTTVPVCQRIEENDQKLLALLVAFPEKFVLITEDRCLGWSSMSLDSYSLQKKKYWKNYFKIPCSREV